MSSYLFIYHAIYIVKLIVDMKLTALFIYVYKAVVRVDNNICIYFIKNFISAHLCT